MWRLTQWLKRIRQSFREKWTRYKTKKVEYKWLALTERVPRTADAKLLLHIGCGEIDSPEFINIDARPLRHVHIVTTNLQRFDMVPDHAVDFIYLSHVLEHISHHSTLATLKELHRILKRNGVIRISVPDFDKMIDIYERTGHDLSVFEQALMGGQDYSYNYHYAVFNEAYLRGKLEASGFRRVRHWDPLSCEHHDFDDWASGTIRWRDLDFPISLNLEATKG